MCTLSYSIIYWELSWIFHEDIAPLTWSGGGYAGNFRLCSSFSTYVDTIHDFWYTVSSVFMLNIFMNNNRTLCLTAKWKQEFFRLKEDENQHWRPIKSSRPPKAVIGVGGAWIPVVVNKQTNRPRQTTGWLFMFLSSPSVWAIDGLPYFDVMTMCPWPMCPDPGPHTGNTG
jgi:hypothetical protein